VSVWQDLSYARKIQCNLFCFTSSVLVVFSFCIWQIRPIPVMDASPSGVTRYGGRWIHGLRDELVLEPLKLGLESS